MKKLATAVSIGVLTLGLGACGDDNGPEQTVKTFHQALQEEDYPVFCDTLAPDLIEPLEQAADGASCAEVLEQNSDDLFDDLDQDAELEIIETTVSQDGTAATVSFTVGDNPQEELSLVQVDDEWKIGSLDPAQEPEGS
ncbi:DUF4878 domain-containing protein [Janibacter cremeus]|uniref:DUF4878 domain-containing protein n=1 Tax=Janibacter cremeus TaxID=1285192 RepID=A0A852VVR9_9MICO|nr:DUF4878 domain-containing protein [Janibacter cremeus]NYF98753.1 hypothetical protein [Janibacter cremeus]